VHNDLVQKLNELSERLNVPEGVIIRLAMRRFINSEFEPVKRNDTRIKNAKLICLTLQGDDFTNFENYCKANKMKYTTVLKHVLKNMVDECA
jgi:hypothetical protein